MAARRISRGPPILPCSSDEDWAEFSIPAQNPKGLHAERWRHIHGCGRFFNAVRDTVSDRSSMTYDEPAEQRPTEPARQEAAR